MTATKLDRDTLKKKYLEERNKRLRADRSDQYKGLENVDSDLTVDPYKR